MKILSIKAPTSISLSLSISHWKKRKNVCFSILLSRNRLLISLKNNFFLWKKSWKRFFDFKSSDIRSSIITFYVIIIHFFNFAFSFSYTYFDIVLTRWEWKANKWYSVNGNYLRIKENELNLKYCIIQKMKAYYNFLHTKLQ